ncbi:hypothetical protein [Cytobacillus gottheilii]|uniref:hypothetical protein n=1 Tax=Cytobacillus gottheilii TaxID=859144 RepID=UPI0009BA28CE|nr:hypothetical protein [Cytobacillus gottheilii]
MVNLDQLELTNDDFYYCYSKRVSSFLSYKGIKYINKGLNPKSGRLYTLYLKNSALQKALKQFAEAE